jgi:MFS family permease
MEVKREEIEKGIREVFRAVLSTKNISARYIVIIAMASLWLDAYDFGAFSFGVNAFRNTFSSMSPIIYSFSIASVQIGAIVGSVIGGWLTDKIGRRNMFTINMIIFTIMAFGAGLSTDPLEFSIFRLILGFALGADTATGFTYIFEYLEAKQRLVWSNAWQLQWYTMYEVTIFGIVLPFWLITNSLIDPLLWRLIMIIGGIFAFIILILRSRIPESALWLAYKGKLATAKRILKKTYGIELQNVPDIDVEYRKTGVGLKSVFSIFRREKWKEVIYSLNGVFSGGIDFWSFGFFVPFMLLAFKLAGALASIEISAIYYGAGVIGSIVSPILTPKVGTKSQYIVGGAIIAISFLGLSLAFLLNLPTWLFVVFVCTFIFGHVIGPVAQGMTSINAFFGPNERGTAAGWGYAMDKVGATIGALIGPLFISTPLTAVSLTIGLAIYFLATTILGVIIGIDARKYSVPELSEN